MLAVTASFLLVFCCTVLDAQNALETVEAGKDDHEDPYKIPTSANIVFDFSAMSKNAVYLLSKPSVFNADYNISVAVCDLLITYLAEIRHAESLKFIASFLDTFPDVTKVYIGGKRTNKKWAYGTGEEVQFFDWAKGSPKQENCIVLTKATGWKMEDYSCTLKGGDPRFLCELNIALLASDADFSDL
ncbi:uncharacterized protein LOC131955809 [Physella acuta]|uniref:uncharacterized protein LOC131955809 n=1 Tax=Physella acuta TaxID=109671 RepID=UPI0027DBAF1F|nr:uncharacterized protein LOC131955809 [Physella acuta]